MRHAAVGAAQDEIAMAQESDRPDTVSRQADLLPNLPGGNLPEADRADVGFQRGQVGLQVALALVEAEGSQSATIWRERQRRRSLEQPLWRGRVGFPRKRRRSSPVCGSHR